MMKRVLILILMATCLWANASHIVGGELALVHIPGTLYRYKIEMILYYDVDFGDTGGDLQARVRLFRKVDNVRMFDLILDASGPINRTDPDPRRWFAIGEAVQYFEPACSQGSIKTNKVSYSSREFELTPEQFNDAQGYYMVYERCCRNYSIDNILSEKPEDGNSDGIADNANAVAGQIFYLEFPAVIQNGEPFINSSPRLFPPLSDYACPNRPYFVDFAGVDVDGDSLVYTMAEPLNSVERFLARPRLGPNPGPYEPITWASGFNINNFMNGKPDLAISIEGLLTVTPTSKGLYVFAVKCEEFRNGIKIGEVRRDFQLKVQNFCATAVPPVIEGKRKSEENFTFKDRMNVVFPFTTADADRCVQVRITDSDITNSFDGFRERIKILARAVGDKRNLEEVLLPTVRNATLTATQTSATFNICFDECPLIANVPYEIHVIAFDDACAIPLSDTLRITVQVQTPINQPTDFITPQNLVIDALNEGDPLKTWPILASDPDLDSIRFLFLTDGFSFSNVGMALSVLQPTKGQVTGTFSWDPTCDKYDFSLKRNFSITLIADDQDACNYNVADTVKFNLTLIPPPNADPFIDTDLTSEFSERVAYGGTHKIYDADVGFNVFAYDGDPYPISLKAEGIGFDMADYDMTFQPVDGLSPLQSPFLWKLSCPQFKLAERDTFAIRFMAIDRNNKCKIYQADTVEVGFKVLPPNNEKPLFDITNLIPETTDGLLSLSTYWDKPVRLQLTASDPDITPQTDRVTIDLVDIESTGQPIQGYTFTPAIPATGISQAQTIFNWQPDCSIFQNKIFENTYKFTFRAYDDHCESVLADTVGFVVKIGDYISTDENFLPPSVITPNGDDLNDFFGMDGYDPRPNGSDPDDEINLPLDNCVNEFESIRIYNRWGKLVFSSTNRFFRWYAPEAGAGVYYYLVKYTNEDYKGSVLVRY